MEKHVLPTFIPAFVSVFRTHAHRQKFSILNFLFSHQYTQILYIDFSRYFKKCHVWVCIVISWSTLDRNRCLVPDCVCEWLKVTLSGRRTKESAV